MEVGFANCLSFCGALVAWPDVYPIVEEKAGRAALIVSVQD